jgi:branched-chain amino acid transport system ATP-binding protein
MNLAEHVWVLAQGQLIASGTPAQVTADARVIEAYLGHGAAARLGATARAAASGAGESGESGVDAGAPAQEAPR